MKKRRVPAALHAELTEYASLLRALRTSNALDLTAHITKPSPFTLPPGLTTKRDHWTRWPLLLEDVPIPEWSLEDEVAVIASRVINSRPSPTFLVPQGPLEHDDPSHTDYIMNTEFEEDDPDHPFYVHHLTSIIASFLSTIFSLLAKHTPSRPASMQNRIQPLTWRSVIDVIAASDIPEYSNPNLTERVIRRMEAIYGPSSPPSQAKTTTSYRAVDRMKNKRAATDRIHKLHEQPIASFFSQASPPPYRTGSPTPPPKRKRNQKISLGERSYKLRKHWVSKAKRSQEHQVVEDNTENQSVSGNPEASQKPVRRSTKGGNISPEDNATEE